MKRNSCLEEGRIKNRFQSRAAPWFLPWPPITVIIVILGALFRSESVNQNSVGSFEYPRTCLCTVNRRRLRHLWNSARERKANRKLLLIIFLQTVITGNHETFQSVQLKVQKSAYCCLFYSVINRTRNKELWKGFMTKNNFVIEFIKTGARLVQFVCRLESHPIILINRYPLRTRKMLPMSLSHCRFDEEWMSSNWD